MPEPSSTRQPFDPIAAALALAIREAIAKREAARAERRAKMTLVRGGKEEPAA